MKKILVLLGCALLLIPTLGKAGVGKDSVVLIYGLGLGGGNLQKQTETDPSLYFANNLYLGAQIPLANNLKVEVMGKSQLSLTKKNFMDIGTFIDCKFYYALD